MFPFAYSCDDFPPDAEMLEEAALGVGKAMRTRHGEGYQAGQACDLTYRSVTFQSAASITDDQSPWRRDRLRIRHSGRQMVILCRIEGYWNRKSISWIQD